MSLGVYARSPSYSLGHLGRSHKLHAVRNTPRHPQNKMQALVLNKIDFDRQYDKDFLKRRGIEDY
jgi:hypothetical protein